MTCGCCQKQYANEPGMIGQPDLEGIYIEICGKKILGTEINICYDCAIKALSSTGGFKRSGNMIKLSKKRLRKGG